MVTPLQQYSKPIGSPRTSRKAPRSGGLTPRQGSTKVRQGPADPEFMRLIGGPESVNCPYERLVLGIC